MPNTKQTYSYVDEWRSMWEPDLDAIGYNGATCDPTKVDPKVLDWVKENCEDTPRFIKVINRNAVHGQPGLLARSSACMCVPRPFVQANFRNLQRVVTMEKNGDAGGKRWKVAFTNTSNQPIWLLGWRQFARDNGLKPGDVVVFELVGNSHFRFTIFDENGDKNDGDISPKSVKRELRSSPHRIVTRKRVILSDSDTGSDTENHHFLIPKAEPVPLSVPETPQKRRRIYKTGDMGKATDPGSCHSSGVTQSHGTASPASDYEFNPLAFTVSSKRRSVTAAERQRARDLAEAHALVTTSPHFLVVMSDTQAYRHSKMLLADQFVKESGFPATGCRITLEDGTGKTWEMHGRENVNFQVCLIRKGWALFALEHLLEEGDVCVFELSDREARSVLVHIFRVLNITESSGNSFRDHYELQRKACRS